MKITECAKKLTVHDKGVNQINIGTAMEVLRVLNKITRGILYVVIKAMPA